MLGLFGLASSPAVYYIPYYSLKSNITIKSYKSMNINKKIKACIIGASGYTGAELIRILYRHENVEIVALAADRNAGLEMGKIYQHLRGKNLPKVVKLDEINMRNKRVRSNFRQYSFVWEDVWFHI